MKTSARRAAGADTALVIATHGRHAVVETAAGQRLKCHLRGRSVQTVVGDRVRWQSSGDEGVIESVEPRRNLLFRQDEWRTKSFAANLDALLVLVAVEPAFSESQLARALIAARYADIPAWIVLNKTDLPGIAQARERLEPYARMGEQLIELSLLGDEHIARDKLEARLHGRTTLVLGPSGSGKSTLINLLVPQAGAQVGEISRALNSGRHTTTSTRWYWLKDDRTSTGYLGPENEDCESCGAIIDSPGFQEFGLRHVPTQELAHHMPDLAAHQAQCRFYNCTHRQEPGCGVRAAVERGEVSTSRWRIYCELFDELSSVRF